MARASAHVKFRCSLLRAIPVLLAGAWAAASASASELEVALNPTPPRGHPAVEAPMVTGEASANPIDLESAPLFVVTFDDDYFWLNSADSISSESGDSLFDPGSFHLRPTDLESDSGVGLYKFRKFKLIRYDRQLNLANREMLLKVRTPGKRKSIMSVELKF